MKKLLLIFTIIALVCAPLVLADNMLEITDITVRVDGSRESGVDENGGDVDDVNPESELKIEINIKNMYDEDVEDLAIEDIEVEVIIEDIDDGDDLDEEVDQFDLDAEEKDEVEVTFDIPLQVEDRSFDMYITINGEDENGTEHNDSAKITIRVEKETHQLKIHKAVLSPNNIACGRTTSLNLEVYNIGEKDEDVEMFIRNGALNIDIAKNYTLDHDIDDDDNVYDKSHTIEIPEGVDFGNYPLSVRVEYDDGEEDEEKLVDLVISECETATTPDTTTDTTPDTTTQTDTQTQNTQTTPDTNTDSQTSNVVDKAPTPKVTYNKPSSSFGQDTSATKLLIILAYIAIIGAVIIIVVWIITKK